jgi:hypothetical protein
MKNEAAEEGEGEREGRTSISALLLFLRPHLCLQWRRFSLFTLQNSGDGKAAKKGGERKGRASVSALLSLSGHASVYKRIGSG